MTRGCSTRWATIWRANPSGRRCFQAAKEFLEALDRREQFDCIVSDVRMPGMTGLDLVKRLNERGYAGPVILITGHGDVDMAVGAIKNGAFDFIEKPFDEARLLASIRQGAERTRQTKSEAAEFDESANALRQLFPRASARSWSLRSQAFQVRRSASGSTSARRPSRTIALGSWSAWAPAMWRI